MHEQNALVFQLNGKIYSRWYYDWESGANKAQRLMKHVLKAYVLEKCGVDAKGQLVTALNKHSAVPQSLLYRVAAVIVSPEFTVISYRRAPNEGGGGRTDAQHVPYYGAPHSQLPSPTASTPSERKYYKRPLDASDVTAKDDRWSIDDVNDLRALKRRRPADSFVRPVASSFSIPRSSIASSTSKLSSTNTFEDRVLWEHAHASAVTTSKNLALLYWFAQWTPLATYAPFVDELVHITHRRLLEPLAPRTHPVGKINCFSRFLLEQAEWMAAPQSSARAVLPYELEALLRVVAQASLWFYSDDTRQWLASFVQQHAASTLDKHALRASFLQWLAQLEERLNHCVFDMTPLKSLANVAEEIISAVYLYERFHSKRVRVRQILGAHGFAGWNAFVAQLRDAYIASRARSPAAAPSPSSGPLRSSFLATAAVRNAFEYSWNSEWLLDTEEAVWKQSELAVECATSLFTVFDLISQLGRLEVALGVQERTLRVRSVNTLALGLDSMHLVLDGRERIFRLFPNGMSSSLGGGATGDYIGSIHMEGSDRLVVYLELFRWAIVPNDPSHHVRMRIECWRSHRLYVNGEVLTTVSPSSFADDERPYVGEMKLRVKRKSVSKAHARQYHAAVAPGQSVPLPPAWKALGRFRLSYHRLGSGS